MPEREFGHSHDYLHCGATDLQPHLLLQQTIGRADARRLSRLGELRVF